MLTTLKSHSKKLILAAAVLSIGLAGQAVANDQSYFSYGDNQSMELLDAINRDHKVSYPQNNRGRSGKRYIQKDGNHAMEMLDAINRGDHVVVVR